MIYGIDILSTEELKSYPLSKDPLDYKKNPHEDVDHLNVREWESNSSGKFIGRSRGGILFVSITTKGPWVLRGWMKLNEGGLSETTTIVSVTKLEDGEMSMASNFQRNSRLSLELRSIYIVHLCCKREIRSNLQDCRKDSIQKGNS